jgi:hypothetical protein
MFIGHYAVGLAAKKWAPKASLGTLVAAAIWLDLVWPLFLLMDMEHFRIIPGITKWVPFDFYDYPLSHSLFMALAWSALLGLVYLWLAKDSRGAWIIGGLVLSHWFLDLIVHRPDLPIWPVDNTGMPIAKYGFGLWNSLIGTLVVEGALFAAGFWIYKKSTKALDQIGGAGLWAFAGVLLVLYGMDFKMAPPNNPNLVSLMGFLQLLFVAWAIWIDDHRKVTK